MVVCVLFSAVIVIKDGAKQQQVCSHLSNSTPFSLCASATFFFRPCTTISSRCRFFSAFAADPLPLCSADLLL